MREVFEAAGVGGLTGRVLSTLGHGAPEVMGHLFLSHLHAKRRARWFTVGLKRYLNALWVEGALQPRS